MPIKRRICGKSWASIAVAMVAFAVTSGCCYVPGGSCPALVAQRIQSWPNYRPSRRPGRRNGSITPTRRSNGRGSSLRNWWTVFNDPTLNRTGRDRLSQNLTLRVAGARILEARAQLGIAVGNLFPQSQSAIRRLHAA